MPRILPESSTRAGTLASTTSATRDCFSSATLRSTIWPYSTIVMYNSIATENPTIIFTRALASRPLLPRLVVRTSTRSCATMAASGAAMPIATSRACRS
jgi:hypothetical protein